MSKANKWLRILLTALALTGWLAMGGMASAAEERPLLRVALPVGIPPYQFMEDGELVGMHIDLLNSIAKERGLELEYLIHPSAADCLAALDTGQADLVLGVHSGAISGYETRLTQETASSSICMVARNSVLSHLANSRPNTRHNAAFEQKTIRYSHMQHIGAPLYVVKSNQQAVFESLISGETDIAYGVKSSMLYQLQMWGLQDDYTLVYEYMAPIQYTMVVQEGDRELMGLLNSGLQQLEATGAYDRISDRWIVTKERLYPNALYEFFHRYGQPIMLGVGVLALGVLTMLWLNHHLKKQVAQKTAELRRANAELEQRIIQSQNETRLLSQIIESSPSGIVFFDKEFHITVLNKNASRLAGRVSLPAGHYLLALQPYRDLLKGRIEQVFEHAAKFQGEVLTRKTEGGERSYRFSILPFYDLSEMSGAVLTVDDITEEMRFTENMMEVEKNRILNQMMAGMAHEIRNPLMAIKTLAQLIRHRGGDAEFQRSFSAIVPEEVDRIDRLMDNLLRYARPGKLSKESVPVAELVNSCLLLLTASTRPQRMRIKVDIPEDMMILASPDQIRQVVINLILNALDAISERLEQEPDTEFEPLLSIEGWESGDYGYLRITDQGVGMTGEEIRRASEPFFSTKSTGSGLGLALSSRYMDENGGEITIDSQKHRYTAITLKLRRTP